MKHLNSQKQELKRRSIKMAPSKKSSTSNHGSSRREQKRKHSKEIIKKPQEISTQFKAPTPQQAPSIYDQQQINLAMNQRVLGERKDASPPYLLKIKRLSNQRINLSGSHHLKQQLNNDLKSQGFSMMPKAVKQPEQSEQKPKPKPSYPILQKGSPSKNIYFSSRKSLTSSSDTVARSKNIYFSSRTPLASLSQPIESFKNNPFEFVHQNQTYVIDNPANMAENLKAGVKNRMREIKGCKESGTAPYKQTAAREKENSARTMMEERKRKIKKNDDARFKRQNFA